MLFRSGKFEYKDTVNKEVVLLQNPSNNVYVYLLPVEGGGCVSVKKEVLMEAALSK